MVNMVWGTNSNFHNYIICDILFQISYGQPDSVLDLAIDENLLPEDFRSWRQPYFMVWDIETLENAPSNVFSHGLEINANLNFASVASSTNLPGLSDVFIMRESSDAASGQQAVNKWLDTLFEWEKVFYAQIPDEIKEAYSDLSDIEDDKFSKQKTKKQRLKNCLKNIMTMPCFGYNSGRNHTEWSNFTLLSREIRFESFGASYLWICSGSWCDCIMCQKGYKLSQHDTGQKW